MAIFDSIPVAKPFLLFAGQDHYPEGGSLDLVGAYASKEKALEAHVPGEDPHDGWAHIFNLLNGKIVMEFSRGTWYEGEMGPLSRCHVH